MARLVRSAAKHKRTVPQEALAVLMEATFDEPTIEPESAYFGHRKVLPEFETMSQSGAFDAKPGDRDITDLISEERDGR